jgi:hypothetical protein
MQVVEASVVVPLSPEETWSFIWDDPRRAVEHFDDIIAVEDFQMRDDGTPLYRMVRKFGPLTMSFISDYYIFERPHQHINRTHESPLGGNFYGTYEPTAEGTRVMWRWEVEPQNALVGLLLPVMRPLLAWSLQRDLDTLARKAGASRGDYSQQDQQRHHQVATSGVVVGGGLVLGATILALYLLLRQRRGISRRWRY